MLLSAAEAQPPAEPRLRWRLSWSDVEKAKDGIYAGATPSIAFHLHSSGRTSARAQEDAQSKLWSQVSSAAAGGSQLREELRPSVTRTGGGRKRPDKWALDWQNLLLQRGYCARNIPREYGGFGLPVDVMELAITLSAGSSGRAGMASRLSSVG